MPLIRMFRSVTPSPPAILQFGLGWVGSFGTSIWKVEPLPSSSTFLRSATTMLPLCP